jgi:Prokaryotic E2 family A/Prokaryotic homologs of the JAB domain/ThiF family
MAAHPWWTKFGQTVNAADKLTSPAARAFAAAIARGTISGVRIVEFRQDASNEAVRIDIDVERPQDLAYPIKATESVAIVFPLADEQPRVLALREDFPDTPHQNWTPEGAPCSLCIDDRPWAEAKLASTPADLVRRVQLWLAKAARGDLHDPAQPLDPLFFRSWLSLVIPPSALVASATEPAELVGFVRTDNPGIILTKRVPTSGKACPQEARFIVLPFQVAPQSMTRLRHAPTTLAGLESEMRRCGVDLIKELKSLLMAWAGMKQDDLRRLNSRLALLVVFPVQEDAEMSVNDLRAFITGATAGEIGVALGILLKHMTQVGGKEAYSIAIGAGNPAQADRIGIDPAEVHFSLNRDLAASVAGRKADRRRTVLVGAGALGSQVAVDLAREGAFVWTVIDQDFLMPHNLARHALFFGDTGAPKAFALAQQMGVLLDEQFTAARCDVTKIDFAAAPELLTSFAEAEIIIDASASVAVSRHLADMPETPGRRICAFFNPVGNAVVVLTESNDRSITLRDLEAQYHDLHLSDERLAGHLQSDQPGLRYSGSCRALTNRIPATRAALLSALAARGIAESLGSDQSSIRIWTTTDDGEVRLVQRAGHRVTRVQLASWDVTYDEGVLRALSVYREPRLPNETGGILLGIIDVSRRSIHVAHAMPQPEDSRGSVTGFERGVVGLLDVVTDVTKASLHQLRYVGEWHSHPAGSSVCPSSIDIEQLAWLGSELEAEGVPALMAIAGDDGAFSFMLLDNRGEGSESVRKRGDQIS